MSPDDPRHGTHRGYVLGCRGKDCCGPAHTKYMKLYRMGRRPSLIDPVGTHRRIQALMALGWSATAIGAACGRVDNWVHMVMRVHRVNSTTAALIARVYDELCMTVPVHPHAPRLRTIASRNGYFPPLAWDDIDDPNEHPKASTVVDHTVPDPVVVQRILDGDWTVPATAPDRAEVGRRWYASGRSLAELSRVTGWKMDRYFKAGEAA